MNAANTETPSSQTERVDNASGTVALVTGAAGGIGQAVCSRLCEAGVDLLITDIHPSIGELANRLVKQGRLVEHLAVDVTDPDGPARALEQCRRSLGTPSILVNCVGHRAYTDFLTIDDDSFFRHIGVNALAPLRWTQAVAAALIEEGLGGSIVNVTSVMAHTAVPRNGAYCASKAAVTALMKTAALEFAHHGIRVNCVAPGPTATPMLAEQLADPEWSARIFAGIPLGRLGAPLDIAAAVLFLASDDSGFVTGTTVFVDGGYTI